MVARARSLAAIGGGCNDVAAVADKMSAIAMTARFGDGLPTRKQDRNRFGPNGWFRSPQSKPILTRRSPNRSRGPCRLGGYSSELIRDEYSDMNAFASRQNWRNPAQLRATRAPVKLDASIVTLNAYQFPELADISQTGAKLRASPLPPKGTSALLRVNGLEVLCRVVWVKGEACGLRFEETVSPATLKQIQLDGAVAIEPVVAANPLAVVDGSDQDRES